jgi:hypothetical protein
VSARYSSPHRVRGRVEPQPELADAPGEQAAGPHAGVAFLQRAAGNAAVTSLLSPTSAVPRALQRYEGGEHARFGGSKGDFKLAGVSGITEGDLIALGDLYETPEDLNKADKKELEELIKLIHRDRKAYETGDAKARVSHEEWEAATKGRTKKGKKTYLELAADNESHFAPRAAGAAGAATAGKDHKSEWEKHHRAALDQAHAAAAGDKKVPNQALVTNAFAAHFLTDAFSAGHLVAKADLMAQANAAFGKLATTGFVFRENQFTQQVAAKVLADAGARKKLDKYLLDFPTRDPAPVTTTNFSELLWQMSSREPDRFFGVFAKIVHDQLNEHIDKLGGIQVDNEAGDAAWPLAGDATLASSPRTLEIGKKAVAASVKNLEIAATTPGALKYDELFKNVWRYTPRPTKDGQTEIAKAIATFGDAAKPEAVAEFAELTVQQLDLAIDTLKAAGVLVDKPKPKATPRGRTKAPAGDRS